MKTKHTPGDWEIKDIYFPGTYAQKVMYIFSNQKYDDKEPICDIWGSATEEGQANAKLIAAAPELLDQLVKARKLLVQNGFRTWSYVIIDIDNAIKKATE